MGVLCFAVVMSLCGRLIGGSASSERNNVPASVASTRGQVRREDVTILALFSLTISGGGGEGGCLSSFLVFTWRSIAFF